MSSLLDADSVAGTPHAELTGQDDGKISAASVVASGEAV
jgi:hypothetical protein